MTSILGRGPPSASRAADRTARSWLRAIGVCEPLQLRGGPDDVSRPLPHPLQAPSPLGHNYFERTDPMFPIQANGLFTTARQVAGRAQESI